jgi:hypothetical protein
MAWLFGEDKFGQYTYEHWFDKEYDQYDETKADPMDQEAILNDILDSQLNNTSEKNK